MRYPPRNLIRTAACFTAAALALAAVPNRSIADAATQPARPHVSQAPMRPGPAVVIKHLHDIVYALDLNDDEKPKVDAVFQQADKDGRALSDELGNTPPAQRYQKLIAFAKQIRQQLAGVLSDDQMRTIDDKLATASAPPRLGNRAAGAGGIADNIQQALDKLDLTDDQKQQIKDVMTQVRQKIADVRAKAQAGENVQQNIADIRNFARDKFKAILSPDQLQSLGDALQQMHQDGAHHGTGSAKPPVVETRPEDLTVTGPDIGDAIPELQILELNGHPFDPSKYKGHVVVMEFGSLSCPVFRQHVQEMEKLKAAEGGRAFFLVVYTREAFPVGDKNVERNRADGIAVTDAKTLDDRKAQAGQAQKQLHITIPMAVDSMDNAASNAFGTFPNGCVVIGKDGTIYSRQQWTNPDTLKMAIDDAANESPAPVASAH